MSQHHEFIRSDFSGYKAVKEFHDYEVSIVRLGSTYGGSLLLVREEDGYAIKQNCTWNHSSPENRAHGIFTRIKYFDSGDIFLDISQDNKRKRWGYRMEQELLSYLPENIHFYGKDDKIFFIYDPKQDVRRRNYEVKNVYQLDVDREDWEVIFHPDGTVSGAKEICRGEKKFAEDKPMKDQLNTKHFKEMTKARLDGDFCVDYSQLFATFRGVQTGLWHMVLEMYRPNKLHEYGGGPNSGLIRKLFVARFVKDPGDLAKAESLAVSITKDLPDSCLGPQLLKIRKKHERIAKQEDNEEQKDAA
jgi:hypothetical protein